MNVNELLDTIEDTLEERAGLPLSGGKRIVDVEQIRDYLDEVRAALPGELRQAQQIVNDRAQIVDSANAQAQAIAPPPAARARPPPAFWSAMPSSSRLPSSALLRSPPQPRPRRAPCARP